MFSGAASKSLFEKGRRADEPGAKGMGSDCATENSPRTQHRGFSMASSLGKNLGRHVQGTGGTLPQREAGRVIGKNAKNSCDDHLPPLGRNEIIKEWQCIILQLPLKQAAEEQDSTRQAIEGQRNGDSAVSFLGAVNQARRNPRVRAQIARLLGFTGHYTDPDFMEGMEKIAQGYLRQQFAMFGIEPAAIAPAMGNSADCAGEEDHDLTGDLFEYAGSA